MKAVSIGILSCFLLLVQLPYTSLAQGKEANNWFFGQHAGISFQNGSPPVALPDGQTSSPQSTGTVSISDDDGNLLFYSDGVTIWNQNHQVMTNGTSMGIHSTGGGVVIEKPGLDDEYYLFNYSTDGNLQYSVIDMSDGLGFVRENEKGIVLHFNTTWHLSAIQHDNMTDIWLLTHERGTNKFLAYRVTADGINTIPVISNAGSNVIDDEGYLKFSTNGERVVLSSLMANNTQLFHFNNQTGQVSNDNVITIPASNGVEFSTDNHRLYTFKEGVSLYQYDLSSDDPVIVLLSGIQITNEPLSGGALQLGPDGKIYVGDEGGYLSVIHNPNSQGFLCNFQSDAIYLEGRSCTGGLPSFNQSILRDPYFTATQFCHGEPTQFSIVNAIDIDSVFWHFRDPFNNEDTSRELNPSFTYTYSGTYYPELTIYSGFISKTVIDTLTIYPIPAPNLGNDTVMCHGAINLTLDAGPGEIYNWNGSMVPGGQFYTVTDTGYYWVRVKQGGCYGYDTIHISVYDEPVVIGAVTVSHAFCDMPTGTIKIIPASGDESDFLYSLDGVTWYANNGFFIGLDAGIYQCWMRYEECISVYSTSVSIENIPGPKILSITVTPENDTSQNGTITVTALSSTGSLNFQLNDLPPQSSNVFTNLSAGSYMVTVRDEVACQDVSMVEVPRESSSSIEENSIYDPPIILPSVISPNSDGINDTFTLTVDHTKVRWLTLYVYNLHGQLQFTTSDPSHSWDALNAKAGLYTWVVVYESKSGKKEETKGKVLVVEE